MVKALTDNFNEIKQVSKGRNASLEVKVVGDMTVANNLTGSSVFTYQPGVAMVPAQIINFADLVPTVNSATGTYVIYRETGGEGSIAVTAPGVSKPQKDYDLTAVTFNASYIAGYTRYAKQMAQDLPFLTSFLPQALRRDYFKAENAIFYAALAAAATVSTTAKTVDVEQLIDDLGTLESLDYAANGIVVNPKDWANIAVTKPNDYSLPGIVSFVNGKLTINGVPVYKASWIPADKYLIGDWSYAKKIVTDGLAVEFFEQDADNVTKNLITARIESRTVLGIDMPTAFILGDFGNVA
jgi:HK97 family phage major capsid protein